MVMNAAADRQVRAAVPQCDNRTIAAVRFDPVARL
jgi:hypothetical protein